MSGADTKNRTRDLLITNQLLYQLSYAGKWEESDYFMIFRKGLPRLPSMDKTWLSCEAG